MAGGWLILIATHGFPGGEAQAATLQETELSPATGNPSGFGGAVAVDGDLAAVGLLESSDDRREVWIFVQASPGVWTEEAVLQAPSPEIDDFGSAVAIDGDTVVVGAKRRGSDGASFVYERVAPGMWSAPEPLPGLSFGRCGQDVAISGDIVVVGCPTYVGSTDADGAAQVFVRDTNGNWVQDPAIVKAGASASIGGLFGWSVAIDGDFIAVGDPGADPTNGSARVYQAQGFGAWALLGEELRPADPTVADSFGEAIDLFDQTLVVGDPRADGGGAAWVFEWDAIAETWNREPLTPTTTGLDSFGSAVGVFDEQIAVGESFGVDPATSITRGLVHDFRRSPGPGWSADGTWVDATGGAGGQLGRALAVDQNRIVVGAPFATVGGIAQGRVFVRDLQSGLGEPCLDASQCRSGFCVDAVCCDLACGGDFVPMGNEVGDCQACAMSRGASQDGVCTVLPAGQVCRGSATTCDAPETCDGISVDCPVDLDEADGEPCNDGDSCTVGDVCQAGVCEAGADVCDTSDTGLPPVEPPAEGCGCATPSGPVAAWMGSLLGLMALRRRRGSD